CVFRPDSIGEITMFDAVESKESKGAAVSPKQRHSLRHIAMIGNFPPRRCGIATFSSDLYDALQSADPALRCGVVAMNDGGQRYRYPETVSLQISQNESTEYASAADQLDRMGVELVSIQHEFGIFGGAAGSHLMTLGAGLDAPAVTTLHTVLEN